MTRCAAPAAGRLAGRPVAATSRGCALLPLRRCERLPGWSACLVGAAADEVVAELGGEDDLDRVAAFLGQRLDSHLVEVEATLAQHMLAIDVHVDLADLVMAELGQRERQHATRDALARSGQLELRWRDDGTHVDRRGAARGQQREPAKRRRLTCDRRAPALS